MHTACIMYRPIQNPVIEDVMSRERHRRAIPPKSAIEEPPGRPSGLVCHGPGLSRQRQPHGALLRHPRPHQHRVVASRVPAAHGCRFAKRLPGTQGYHHLVAGYGRSGSRCAAHQQVAEGCIRQAPEQYLWTTASRWYRGIDPILPLHCILIRRTSRWARVLVRRELGNGLAQMDLAPAGSSSRSGPRSRICHPRLALERLLGEEFKYYQAPTQIR